MPGVGGPRLQLVNAALFWCTFHPSPVELRTQCIVGQYNSHTKWGNLLGIYSKVIPYSVKQYWNPKKNTTSTFLQNTRVAMRTLQSSTFIGFHICTNLRNLHARLSSSVCLGTKDGDGSEHIRMQTSRSPLGMVINPNRSHPYWETRLGILCPLVPAGFFKAEGNHIGQ